MENNKYKELYKKLGYTFKNEEVIETALRHPSMCYSKNQKCDNYERLELLGDSVLSLIILDMLLKYYKNLNEGEIAKRKSNLVCSETLSKIAKNMETVKITKVGYMHNIKLGNITLSHLPRETAAERHFLMVVDDKFLEIHPVRSNRYLYARAASVFFTIYSERIYPKMRQEARKNTEKTR